MIVYTIGFTKKSAEQFFTRLKQPGLVRLLDVRLNNVSQLAGFAKRDDLRFFLKEIVGIDYLHMKEHAPTKAILDAFKKTKVTGQHMSTNFSLLCKRGKLRKESQKRSLAEVVFSVVKPPLNTVTGDLWLSF